MKVAVNGHVLLQGFKIVESASVILFIMLYKVVLTFESMDEIFTSTLSIQMRVLMPYITVVDL